MTEHQTIEWKENWRDEYLRWICGFANAQGGTLIIGKNNKGQPAKLKDARRLLQEIPNKVRDVLGILVDVNLRKEKGHDLVEIVVEKYPYPISYKGEYHYRTGSTKQELKGAALDRFLLRKQGKHWDGVPVPNVGVGDLNAQTIVEFRRRAHRSKRLSREILQEPDRELLEKLHLTEGDYLKRAAILLFHPDPEKFVTGASVKIGYFRTDADLLYHDEIRGNLFVQADKALDLLLSKYLKALISYEGVQRVETYPLPEEALREALLNAIAHKDYASGAPIQISVYEDKLLIWNPGHLPSGWTLKRLTQKHSSQPYNPDIANAFFRAGMIESWGRGIERILEACKSAHVPAPKLRLEGTGLWVEFTLRKQPRTPVKTPVETLVKSSVKTRVETRVKTPVKILQLLQEKPDLSLAELAAAIGKSVSAMERASAKLVKTGKLRRVGPTKGGHWEVLHK